MTRNRLYLLVLLALAAGILIAGMRLRNRDEAVLRREIRRMAARLEKKGPEGPIAAAARAREISEMFVAHPHFEMSVVPYVPDQRSELTSAVFQARAMLDTLSVRLHDVSVRVAEDRQTARMTLSATAAARRGAEAERASRAFEIDWQREPEGWRIARVREVQVLRRIPGADAAPVHDARSR